MMQFENDYCKLVQQVLAAPERKARNGGTIGLFGAQLKVDLAEGFPLLLGRKMFVNGILGELAAMLRGPKKLEDFTKWGCNYWEKWAKENGTIEVDYGNAWLDFNGVNQLEELRKALKHDYTSRRMVVNSWMPGRIKELDLPCCHYAYQFYVTTDNKLDMVWVQRSADMMVGLPSDIVFAAAWLMSIANEFGFGFGTITLQLGDCHIYNEHVINAEKYLEQAAACRYIEAPEATLTVKQGLKFETFEPKWLTVTGYNPKPAIKFLLKE